MPAVFSVPYEFREKRFRSSIEICRMFLPAGYDSRDYLKSIEQNLALVTPSTDSEFINAIKPSPEWLFFNGILYENVKAFLVAHRLPGKLEPFVQELISSDPVDVESSLIMMLQRFKADLIARRFSSRVKIVSGTVMGKYFDDVSVIRKLAPFVTFERIEVVGDVEQYVISVLDSYFSANPIKLGVVSIDSFTELQRYTSYNPWELLSRLKGLGQTPVGHIQIFKTTSQTDSPLVVGGELFSHINDALRSYAIPWASAMSYLSVPANVTPNIISSMFGDLRLVGKNREDMVEFEGQTMTLSELLGIVGGRASIFLARMKEVHTDYSEITIQRMIEFHMLEGDGANPIGS